MRKIFLIELNGTAKTGKDTFVKYFKEIGLANNCVVRNFHKSDKPKELLKCLGWDREKNQDARTVLAGMTEIYTKSEKCIQDFKTVCYELLLNPAANHFNVVLFFQSRDKETKRLNQAIKDIEILIDDPVKYVSVYLYRNGVENTEINYWSAEMGEYDVILKLENGIENTKKAAENFFYRLFGGNKYDNE